MMKNKIQIFSVPFIGISTIKGIVYDDDKLSFVGKILNHFIPYNRDNFIDYRDVLACVGIKDDECILKGMPILYKKRKNILPEDVDFACTFRNGSHKNLIVNTFCDESYILDSDVDLNNRDLKDYILEIDFFVYNYSGYVFKLLIDIESGYILLCDDSFTDIYLINNEKVSGDRVVVKRASYGAVSRCPDKAHMEWMKYNIDNPNNRLSYDEYYEKFIKKTNPLIKLILGK